MPLPECPKAFENQYVVEMPIIDKTSAATAIRAPINGKTRRAVMMMICFSRLNVNVNVNQ